MEGDESLKKNIRKRDGQEGEKLETETDGKEE